MISYNIVYIINFYLVVNVGLETPVSHILDPGPGQCFPHYPHSLITTKERAL